MSSGHYISNVLEAWNTMNARQFGDLFSRRCKRGGFDRDTNGKGGIENHLAAIFGDHEVAKYLLAGIAPPGQADINAVQSKIVHETTYQ